MKKDIIKRDNHENNQFVRLTTATFFDERLTDAGCRLLIAILNNSEDWKVNTTYYGNKFGWSSGKTTGAKKNLMECGYLKEEVEMTSKGKVYHYTIAETATNKGESLYPISKDWKPKIENQTLETNDWKLGTNNSNIDKNNLDKSNPEKNKEIKISDSVSVNVSTTPEVATPATKQKDTNTPLQLKDDFFFSYGERPSEEKIIEYVEKQGYPREVGSELFVELHTKDFKNKKGIPIKGIEKYIDSMLQDKSKHSHDTSIESFLEAVNPVNETYIRNSMKANKDLSIHFQTSMLNAKEASKEYWNSVSKDKNEYIKYMMEFVKLKGWKPMSGFKAYVFKHRERQIQSTGKTYC